MKIIRPVDITDTVLVSSNIPEDDYPVWVSGTTYSEGDRVISTVTHKIYEALQTSTGKDPTTNPIGTNNIPYWLDLGATNKWRMFDGKTQNLSTFTDEIIVQLQTPKVVNSIALFGLQATSVRVTMTDDVEGIVYDTGNIPLQDFSSIDSWWTYYYEDISAVQKYSRLDLPTYRNSIIEIHLTGIGNVSCGQVVIGNQQILGLTDYGTSIGIMDYSRKTRDIFGNAIILERAFNETVDYDVTIDSTNVRNVQQTLAKYRATPLVWIGDEQFEETIIYGFYKDFNIILSNFSISDCVISVEGLS